MLADKGVNAVELSALRQEEFEPLIEDLENLDLRKFQYIGFHVPSSLEPSFEGTALKLLEQVAGRGWPLIVHPNVMNNVEAWAKFDRLLCIENMDKRKPIGQTAADLVKIFRALPRFDIGHARQVDPTMSEATRILQLCGDKLRQLHVSDVNTQSKHDSLSLESMLAFQRVGGLLPDDIPAIMESRVDEGTHRRGNKPCAGVVDAKRHSRNRRLVQPKCSCTPLMCGVLFRQYQTLSA